MPLPLNLNYVKSAPGLFKCISLVTGLLAISLTAAALASGRYYNDKCPENAKNDKSAVVIFIPAPIFIRGGGYLKDTPTCEQRYDGNYQNCQFIWKLSSQLRKIAERHDFARHFINNKDWPQSCPIRLLVIIPLSLLSVIWLPALVEMIVMLIVDLNKKWENFIKFDFIFQLIVAILGIISALIMAVFLGQVLIEADYPCTDLAYNIRDGLEKENRGRPKFVNASEYRASPGGSGSLLSGIRNRQSMYEECSDEQDDVYKIYLLLAGTIFGVLFGFFTVFAAIMVKSAQQMVPLLVSEQQPFIMQMQSVDSGQYQNASVEQQSLQATPSDSLPPPPQEPQS